MTRKKSELTVSTDLSDLFAVEPQQPTVMPAKEPLGISIQQAFTTVLKQMVTTGHRERTMSDYELHVRHFAKVTGVVYMIDINVDHIYGWLSSMNVSNQTKLTQLKCLKAFLGRSFDNGWLTPKFWRNITIKVDSPIKQGAAERDVYTLLSLLDLTDFVQLRDATALLMFFQTGIRIGTLTQLKKKHVDLEANVLRIDGGLLKNHEQMHLPFDAKLNSLLSALMEQNDKLRSSTHVNNDYIFITIQGGAVSSTPTNNVIRKRLSGYSKMYGLQILILMLCAGDLLNDC